MTAATPAGEGTVAGRVVAFCGELRAAGLAVGTSETRDALGALESIGWESRTDFREALATTLAKSQRDREVFDLVFERFFFRTAEGSALDNRELLETELEPALSDELRDAIGFDDLGRAVAEAIESGDRGQMAELGRLAIELFRTEGEPSGVVGVDLQRIRRGLGLRASDDRDGTGLPSSGIREFEEMVREELNRRQIARQGKLPPSKPMLELNRALPTQGARDLAEVRRAVVRMKRRLATLGQEQRGSRRTGTIDLRRTMRASLETGGVPLRLGYRPKRPRKPEIFVLCDVSTSVSSSSTFFLSVLHALHDSFRRLRSFVFVERISEVTHLFEEEREFPRISERISAEGGVVDVSGYTDYGRVWLEFLEGVAPDLGPRSNVIVLGDARTNGRPPATDAFAQVASAAGKIFWLNPEPRPYWNYGDSVMSAYLPSLDGAYECWKTEHLEQFVDLIASGRASPTGPGR